MTYEKRKPRSIKEKKADQKARENLIYMLKEEGADANNTAYNKRHRADQIIEMLDDLIDYLDDDPRKLLMRERDILIGLTKQLTLFLVEKSAENKREINTYLRKLEIVSKENVDIMRGVQPIGVIRNG